MSAYVARRLREEIQGTDLDGWFGPNVTLVPAPKSSKLLPHSLWPAQRLCDAFINEGLGASSLPCLVRTVAVPKAATSRTMDRTRPRRHLETMEVQGALVGATDEILVVDDVVTRGATLLAAVSLLQVALANARVRGFAVVRTMSAAVDLDRIVEPCSGEIRLLGNGQTRRTP
jgi:hypothetical protein